MLFDKTKFNSYVVDPDKNCVLAIELKDHTLDVLTWIEENKLFLEELLLTYGAILLRDFELYSVTGFNKVAKIFCNHLFDYQYRSTPRTKLGGQIYTATEYPKHRFIPLHNENSYQHSWNSKILFFCIIPALEGGETILGDSRRVYNMIDRGIVERFNQDGVLYVRNYHKNVDLSWQEVFQTKDRNIVEQYCIENNINFEWGYGNPELRTTQVSQATIIHPITRQHVWFNQAHLFHSSAIDLEDRAALIKELGVENLPRNTFYGDKEEIPLEILEHIHEVYNKEKIKFPWHQGDILIVDNVLMAHGRETFKGDRKVAVAMGDSV